MEEITVPQTLDAPLLVLVFNASHLFSFIGFSIFGAVINHPFIAAAVGLIVGSFINKFQDKKPDGYLRHIAYYVGIPVMKGRCVPHGLDREFRP